jgi:hypothetical protein
MLTDIVFEPTNAVFGLHPTACRKAFFMTENTMKYKCCLLLVLSVVLSMVPMARAQSGIRTGDDTKRVEAELQALKAQVAELEARLKKAKADAAARSKKDSSKKVGVEAAPGISYPPFPAMPPLPPLPPLRPLPPLVPFAVFGFPPCNPVVPKP